jgi:hypothetical protein
LQRNHVLLDCIERDADMGVAMPITLMNNAHYKVEIVYRVNAVGGSNHEGRVVTIRQKKTFAYIELPAPVFRRIALAALDRLREKYLFG